jgi:PhnB protein
MLLPVVRLVCRGAFTYHRQGEALHVQPSLCFDGRCEEAVAFSTQTLGAEVRMLLRFQDSPEPPQPGMVSPGAEHKVRHTRCRIGKTMVRASDGPCTRQPSFQGFALLLTVPYAAAAAWLFAALADGGQVQMPLTTTVFAPRFGMVADRFGVSWSVTVAP